MAKYRVGVIGCGRKGGSHARAYALNPLTEVVAFADTDPENLELVLRILRRSRVQRLSGDAPEGTDRYRCTYPAGQTQPRGRRWVCRSGCKSHSMRETYRRNALQMQTEWWQPANHAESSSDPGDLDRNLPQYWKALEIIESGELGEVKSINFIGGSGTEMSGGGCQLFSLMRMFAGDADVAWVIGWVADDPEERS